MLFRTHAPGDLFLFTPPSLNLREGGRRDEIFTRLFLSLPLLVLGVLAEHTDRSFSPDDLAVDANLLDR